jgi:biopolymer transport protein TolQ
MTILIAAFLVILQADSGIAPAGPPNSSAVAEMIANMGSVAIGVLILLSFASLYSWTVIIGKMSAFSKATKESRRFIRAFRKATRLQEIAQLAADCKASPLAQVYEDVYEAYKRQTGGSGPPRNLVPLERSALTAASEAVTALERRMTWLATIASVSPFVGLFGTVWGIIDAFHGLGSAGAATLRAVAPGISEALITTAAGLFVAVPALIAYNQFTARIRVFASAVDDFCRELLNSLEEIPVRTAVSARPAGLAGSEPSREAERGLYK